MINLFTSTFVSFSLSFSLQFFYSHFLLPHFTFPPDRTFFDVLNFKLIDFDSFFVARSFNFSLQGLSSFISEFKFIPFTLCVRTQLWRSSLTTNWSQHNCAFLFFPIPLLYSGSNSSARLWTIHFALNCNPPEPQLNAMVPNLRFNFHGKKGFGKEFSILIHLLFPRSVVHFLFHLLSQHLLHLLLL
jgi:hypothetical protein